MALEHGATTAERAARQAVAPALRGGAHERDADRLFEGAGISLLPRSQWATGDYVVGEVPDSFDTPFDVELATGRMADVVAGDALVGAFGRRSATLEAVGDWTEIGSDLRMHALTRAGSSVGDLRHPGREGPTSCPWTYRGHVTAGGRRSPWRRSSSRSSDGCLPRRRARDRHVPRSADLEDTMFLVIVLIRRRAR